MEKRARLTLAAIVLFLNEEQLLPRVLGSLSTQSRVPDLLLLVDDGSTDDSPVLAAAFAEQHLWARVLTRQQRPPTADRLADAAELIAFQWALDRLPVDAGDYDVIAKLDGDLELPPDFFERIMEAFETDASLGIAGAPLAVEGDADEPPRIEYSQPWHVRGATKFYRRSCWTQIRPLPSILGWDTIDETRASLNGWRVRTVPFPERAALHLRPTGSYDGAVRGFYRRGVAAWGYGSHPVNVIASTVVRMPQRPRVLGGLAYLAGWTQALLRGAPRAERSARRHLQQEQLRRLRASIVRGAER